MDQNKIQLRIVPVNPTVADSVMLIADLQFSSSACLLDSKSHSVNGNSIVASTHYCIGIAAAICNTIDTFHLGKLNPGNYNVGLSLSSGGAPVPCSPGIVPDDFDTLSFSVQTGLGLKEQKAPIFNVYPNPFEESFTIDLPHLNSSDYTIEVFNLLGAKLVEQTSSGGRIDIDLGDVDAGIYFVKVNKGDNINMIQLNKINQ